MRIIQIHDTPSPGGAYTVISHLDSLINKRHSLDTIKISNKPHQELHGTKRIINDSFGFLHYLIKQYLLSRHINQQYSMAIVHHGRFIHAPTILRFLKIPTIYYCHEPPRALYEKELSIPKGLSLVKKFYEMKIRQIRKQLDYLNVQKATLVVTNSAFTAQNIKKTYKRDAFVVGVGINTKTFKKERLQKKEQIISVGNAQPQKNYTLAIKAISLLPASHRPRYIIVGNQHTDKDKLLNLARINNVKLTFKTNISTQELVRLYNASKIALASAINEPLGIFPLEAMACGLPVIALNQGGFAQTILNNKTGLLVNNSPESFSKAIFRLLVDDQLSKRLSTSAIHHIKKNYSWKLVQTKMYMAIDILKS